MKTQTTKGFHMKKMLLIAMALFSFQTLAHVEPGDFIGRDQAGNVCSFTVGDMWFENDMHHPLTERLQVSKVQFINATVATAWNLGHPPVINTEVGSNRYNHDIFQQIIPLKTGAISLTLIKAGEEKDDAKKPVGIIFVDDNYRNAAESKKLTCLL
jgi:hypothetical protein